MLFCFLWINEFGSDFSIVPPMSYHVRTVNSISVSSFIYAPSNISKQGDVVGILILSFYKNNCFSFFFTLFIWLHWVFITAHRILVAACGIQLPDQGLNLGLQHQECRVLATEPPGKSLLILPLNKPGRVSVFLSVNGIVLIELIHAYQMR